MLFLIIFFLSLASSFIFTWWAAAVITFFAALYLGKSAKESFWSGFFALAFLWILLALFKSIPNDHILAAHIAQMVHIPNWTMLLLITVIIGGLVGGMASISGFLLKRAFINEEVIDK